MYTILEETSLQSWILLAESVSLPLYCAIFPRLTNCDSVTRYSTSDFFLHQTIPSRPMIHALKYFRISCKFAEIKTNTFGIAPYHDPPCGIARDCFLYRTLVSKSCAKLHTARDHGPTLCAAPIPRRESENVATVPGKGLQLQC
jgi:hypothetical protein